MSRHHIEQIHESTSNLHQLCTHKYGLRFASGSRPLGEMRWEKRKNPNKKHQNVELSLKSLPVSMIKTSVEETDQVANFAQDAALKNIKLVTLPYVSMLFPFFLRITLFLQVDWILLHRGCFCSRNPIFFWQISPSVSHRNSDKLFNRLQTAAALLILISDQSANYFMYVLYNLKATTQTAASCTFAAVCWGFATLGSLVCTTCIWV